jgi:outer membrane protein TolC
MGELAAALAVPIETLRALQLDFSRLDALPDTLTERDARGEALRNRVDMRQRLLEFSAADAEVKLEIARQYPTVSLRPGYLWDQGDNVWLLAVDLFAPPLLGNAPAIEVAQAHRETAAHIALRDQAAIIAETDTALVAYRQSVAGARAAHQASLTQLARASQAQKQFDAGYADRIEATQSRLEAIAVERNLWGARTGAQRALGRLEDALQRPLSGGPLPAYSPPAPAEAAAQ